MSDDAPTERFDAATAPLPRQDGAEVTSDEVSDGRSRRGMLITIIALAAAILVALIVVIVLLVQPPSDDEQPVPLPTPTLTPSESLEPSESPEPVESESPVASPAPSASSAPSSPSFATFQPVDEAECADESGQAELTWSWSSTNASRAWFGIGTRNAKEAPFEEVATTATYTFWYQCSEASQLYTVTLEDSAGRLTHRTVEVVRQ